MNPVTLAGYRLWWQERKAHRDTRVAYDSLVIAHQRALADLATPCSDCERYQDERDDALLKLDTVEATLVWFEREFKLG